MKIKLRACMSCYNKYLLFPNTPIYTNMYNLPFTKFITDHLVCAQFYWVCYCHWKLVV